eukprot:gene17510-17709_t
MPNRLTPVKNEIRTPASYRGDQMRPGRLSGDVVHSSDNPDANPRRTLLSHPMHDDWTTSRDCFERTHVFLGRHVRNSPAR